MHNDPILRRYKPYLVAFIVFAIITVVLRALAALTQ